MKYLLITIAGVFFSFLGIGQKKNDSTKSNTTNNAKRDVNKVGRDQNSAGRDVKVDNRKFTKVIKDSSVKTQKIVDQSNNQGGININAENGDVNITIPEEDIREIKGNFQIQNRPDFIKNQGQQDSFSAEVIAIGPLVGRWSKPYVAYRISESETEFQGDVGFSVPSIVFTVKKKIFFEGDSISVRILVNGSFQASPKNLLEVYFKNKMPDFIIFGDNENPQQSFSYFPYRVSTK